MPFFAWSTGNSWLQFVLLILLSSCFPTSTRQEREGMHFCMIWPRPRQCTDTAWHRRGGTSSACTGREKAARIVGILRDAGCCGLWARTACGRRGMRGMELQVVTSVLGRGTHDVYA